MGLPRCTSSLMMGAQLLFSFTLVGALNVNPLSLQEPRHHDLDTNLTLASSCQRFLCIKDGTSSSNGVYPWLINNNNARFGYVKTEGRVFIYNSENDYCPETTYNYWYFWKNGDWVYNTGIYLQTC